MLQEPVAESGEVVGGGGGGGGGRRDRVSHGCLPAFFRSLHLLKAAPSALTNAGDRMAEQQAKALVSPPHISHPPQPESLLHSVSHEP